MTKVRQNEEFAKVNFSLSEFRAYIIARSVIDCLKRHQVRARLPQNKTCRILFWRLLNTLLTKLKKRLRTSPDANFSLTEAFNWSKNSFVTSLIPRAQ